MDKTNLVLLILMVTCVTLQVFIVLMAAFMFDVIRGRLDNLSTNQMLLSRNANTRISTASMPTGMPDPTKPPRVQETQQIGRGARGRRRVVGGDPTSQQYAGLERGLPKDKEDKE